MRIFQEAGLPNHGLTQPCSYRDDEALYAHALLAADGLAALHVASGYDRRPSGGVGARHPAPPGRRLADARLPGHCHPAADRERPDPGPDPSRRHSRLSAGIRRAAMEQTCSLADDAV